MGYTNSDQVIQSMDGLEKYRLFTESKLRQLICKEFNQCSSILRDVFQKFSASVVQSWSGLH